MSEFILPTTYFARCKNLNCRLNYTNINLYITFRPMFCLTKMDLLELCHFPGIHVFALMNWHNLLPVHIWKYKMKIILRTFRNLSLLSKVNLGCTRYKFGILLCWHILEFFIRRSYFPLDLSFPACFNWNYIHFFYYVLWTSENRIWIK